MSKSPTHAGAVYALLRDMWPKNAYAMLPEVGNSTGANTKRHADAVVMSLWPSRGLHIYGVEIKVSRSDWLSELRNPEKAEAVQQYCDGWFVAVAEKRIVADGELPPTWGLIACDGGKAKIVKPAPPLSPKPLTPTFVAAMLRRASEFVAPDEWVKDKVDAIWENSRRNAEAIYSNEAARAKKEAEEIRKAVADFEANTGVSVVGYSSSRSAQTFKMVKRAIDEMDMNVEYQADRLERAAKLLREAAAMIPKQPESEEWP